MLRARLPYFVALAAVILSAGTGTAAANGLHLVGATDTVAAQAEGGRDGLTGFKVRFKSLPFDEKSDADKSGIAKVVDRATKWVHGLELGWSGLGGGASRLVMLKVPNSDDPTSSLAGPSDRIDTDTPATMFNAGAWRAIQSVSRATLSTYDGSWTMHPQPSMGFVSGSGTTGVVIKGATDSDSPIGRAMAEQSLAARDIEVGVPLSPWLAVAGSRYWWGAQDITQEVRGSRVGLKLTPTPFFEIEGGRMQDSERNNGTFVSARLNIPLGMP